MGMKPGGIDTGRHHLRLSLLKVAVTAVLLISFLTGAGNHQIRLRQGALFSAGRFRRQRLNKDADAVRLALTKALRQAAAPPAAGD